MHWWMQVIKELLLLEQDLGHVNKELYPAIERAHAKGVHMYMTLQTIWGYVHMFVYDTGRDMMAKGIIPAGNMLPEVAWVKLSWVLGQTDDPKKVKEMMLHLSMMKSPNENLTMVILFTREGFQKWMIL